MHQFRRISTLNEDMEKLGLKGLVEMGLEPEKEEPKQEEDELDADGKPKKKEEPVAEAEDDKKDDDKEDKKDDKEKVESRKHRAEARKKAKAHRKKRMEAKVQRYEVAIKKKGKKARTESKEGQAARLAVLASLNKQIKIAESFSGVKFVQSHKTRKEVVEAFKRVSNACGALARRFSVVEHFLSEAEAGLPVIHPESGYGWEINLTNIKDGNKEGPGEVTDYADGKQKVEAEDPSLKKDDPAAAAPAPKAEEDPAAAVKDPDVKEDDDQLGLDKDDLCICNDDDDDMDLDGEEDSWDMEAEEKDDEKKMGESLRRDFEKLPMDFELNSIRLEAEEMAHKVVVGTVGPMMAADILDDMVSYLGGAMKVYADLVVNTDAKPYVGQDAPAEAPAKPEADKENPEAYVGQDAPKGDSPVVDGAPKQEGKK